LISTALEAQDATSVALQDDDALHYLNAMLKLLKEVKAPKKEIAKLERLYEEQNHSGAPRLDEQMTAEEAASIARVGSVSADTWFKIAKWAKAHSVAKALEGALPTI
jgi:hypothetical protein